MNAMPGGRRDALPVFFFFVALHVAAGADARRFLVLDVADQMMQRSEYFSPIITEMDNGGREALLHVLQQRQLAEFDVRRVPWIVRVLLTAP